MIMATVIITILITNIITATAITNDLTTSRIRTQFQTGIERFRFTTRHPVRTETILFVVNRSDVRFSVAEHRRTACLTPINRALGWKLLATIIQTLGTVTADIRTTATLTKVIRLNLSFQVVT